MDRFIEWFLPYTNYNLKIMAIKRRENNLHLRRIYNMDDVLVKQTSEKQASQIIGQELGFYRDIDQLKQQFVKDHSHNIHDILKFIEFNEHGLVDYQRKICQCKYFLKTSQQNIQIKNLKKFQKQDNTKLLKISPTKKKTLFLLLKNFMRSLNIQFNEEECQGFFYRCSAIDSQNKEISYDELIQSIIPHEPQAFKAYQNTFDKDDLQQYVIKKAEDFQFDVHPLSFGKKPPKEKKNMMQHFYPFRKCFDPYTTGKMQFNRDQGYMTELTQYSELYFNPSKDNSCIIRNSNKNGGIRSHDHFFDRYYALLYDREKSEILYNKLGKRYVFDKKMSDVRNEMKQSTVQSRIRSQSQYNYNNTKQSLIEPTDRINQFKPDDVANKKSTQPHNYSQESQVRGYRDNTPTMRYGQKFSDEYF